MKKNASQTSSGKREKKIKKRRVPLLLSIRFRIMFTIGVAVFIAVASVLYVVTLPVREELEAVNTDYLYNQTWLYGQKLETAVNLTQYHTDIRKVPFRLEAFLQGARLERCESSHCFLVRDDGIVLYHPDHARIGRQVTVEPIRKVAEQVGNGTIPEPDIVTYTEDGAEKIASYYASSKGFVLVIAADRSDFLSTINQVTRLAVMAGCAVFVLMLLFGLLQALRITRPIRVLSEVVDRIGEMDFTDDPRTAKLARRRDETGLIASSVQNMRAELVKIIGAVKSQSAALYGTSTKLMGSAQETNQNASFIQSTVGEIATGADETMRVNQDISTISSMIVETSAQVSALTETADRMREASEKAFETLAALVQTNQQTTASIELIHRQTNETNRAAENIKKVAGLITDIADETNILSLNARIEAARAGKAGVGFSVVADNVRKLAVESGESAANIGSIIRDLIENSTKAVETMEEVREVMRTQSTMVEQTASEFRIVREGIDGSLINAGNIREHTDGLDVARVSITDTVENLSSVASQNAERSKETFQSLRRILSALQAMTAGIDKLNEIAKTLDGSVSEIRI